MRVSEGGAENGGGAEGGAADRSDGLAASEWGRRGEGRRGVGWPGQGVGVGRAWRMNETLTLTLSRVVPTWRMNAMSAALCTKEAATKSTPRLTPKFCRWLVAGLVGAVRHGGWCGERKVTWEVGSERARWEGGEMRR